MQFETLLDELDSGSDLSGNVKLSLPGLSPEIIQSLKAQGNPVAALAGTTTDKSYLTLHRHRNVLSNSINDGLHSCPRFFIQEKISANQAGSEIETFPNVDFIFGHSVGAGVQTYVAFDCNLPFALYASFLSWRTSWDVGREDWNKHKKKTIERAIFAVEKFAYWWNDSMADEWEVFRLEDGTPAVELSFCIDLGKAKYFGHIDIILRNKRTGKIAIGENKTTGFVSPNAALYQNSAQAIGYAIVLDVLVGELADYDVLYYAYSAKGEEWHFLPFAKTTSQKMEWIQDRLIDIGHVEQYFGMRHFPKDGRSCFRYNRECKYFGTCDLLDKEEIDRLPKLEDGGKKEYPVNFYFSVEDLVNRQTKGIKE